MFDVAIIGGGITGVSTAYRLQMAGKRCILIEAANIGFGTTGGTTAHLNDFFDTSYADAIAKFGLDAAQLLRKAGKEARKVDYEMSYIPTISYPIPFKKAVLIKDQAQFHPIKYIKALCHAFIEMGGIILEDCRRSVGTVPNYPGTVLVTVRVSI